MAPSPQLEILDLRHFNAAQLRPLLEDEARLWNQRLRWDYTSSVSLLLDYFDGRTLPGYVAVRDSHPVGYAFCVFESAKSVIGDIYALGETLSTENPICDTLAQHLLETLQATPGVDRIEAQLLMFPRGALATPFLTRGFRAYPRVFMDCALPSTSPAALLPELRLPGHLRLVPWHDQLFEPAGELVHRCYLSHVDSQINDQYQTTHGSLRFLHNIVRFPGCGLFDAANSWALRDDRNGQLKGLLLCSRVRADVGHITQLCVAPSLRGRGLGRALLHRCLAQFTRRGFSGLSLTVTEANTEARALYASFGFTDAHAFDAMVWDKNN